MRRTALKKIGKRGKINIAANKKLKELYTKTNIRECEIKLEGCLGNSYLGLAHKHRRSYYYTRPGLDIFSETILACVSCHQKIDSDKKLLLKTFHRLRN